MLSERLKLAMSNAGVSQAALARACGVKQPSVYAWLSGKSKFLRGANLLCAARFLNVSEDWLATGTGEMKSDGKPYTPPITEEERALLALWGSLTARQQQGFLEAMTAQKRDNDALMAELAGRRK
jgi:transcriptional regulator with XRE-family HTH domain